MKFFSLFKGVAGLLAGQVAAQETAKTLQLARKALAVLVVSLVTVAICALTVTFYVLLKIIEWFSL